MKTIILFFALTVCVLGYSQKDFQKKEIISTDAISILYDNQRLVIDQRNNNRIHFEIWKNKVLILNSEGSAKGIESFPASKGKYKIIIFNERGKVKTKFFYI